MGRRLHGTCPDLAVAAAVLLACLGAFFLRAWHGMRFSTFGDETEHFVGAQVLQAGGLLYRDFIELHGPLDFALPQLYGALFGWAEPLHARIVPVLLTLGAGVTVCTSAALRGVWERMTALSVFLGLVTAIWIVQGLCLFDYQPPAGALLLAGFAQFTLPACLGIAPGAASLFTAGLCLAMAPFMAFSYGPASLLFAASGAWGRWRQGQARPLRAAGTGAALGIAVMAVWLAVYADWRGYLVFHFLHAIVDFGPYLGFGAAAPVAVLWQPLHRATLVQAMGETMVVAALCAAAARRPGKGARRIFLAIPWVLAVAGILETNPRGSPIFQNGGFLIVAAGFAALAFARMPRVAGMNLAAPRRIAWSGAACALVAGAEAVARQATTTPHGYHRSELATLAPASLAMSEAPWARRIRQVTTAQERILAVPFWPDMYPLAGRLPMKGYVIYLPWDADYARHPWFGVQHDLCADIQRDPPPVIYDNGWVVWNLYDPARYMACLQPILATRYTPMPGAPFFYVRTDRMALLTGDLPR